LVDSILDEVGGFRVALAERQIPRFDLAMEAYFPRPCLDYNQSVMLS